VNLNLTLFGQMITFALFVFVTMRYVWPPITKALEDRRTKIAEGLEAAERGKQELKLAQEKATDQLRDAKKEGHDIIAHANQTGARLVEDSKEQARNEGKRLLELAKADIDQEYLSTKSELVKEVAGIVVQGVEKVLQEKVDPASHSRLVDQVIAEI